MQKASDRPAERVPDAGASAHSWPGRSVRLDPRPAVSPRPGGASTAGRGPLPRVAAKAPDTRVQIPSAVSRPRDLGQRTYLLCEVGVMVTAPAGGEEEVRWWVPGTDEGTARARSGMTRPPLTRDDAAPSHAARVSQGTSDSERGRWRRVKEFVAKNGEFHSARVPHLTNKSAGSGRPLPPTLCRTPGACR